MENYSLDKIGKFKIIIILSLIASLSLGVYMYQVKTVEVQIDDEIMEVKSYSDTVENFLSKEEIVLEEGAYINQKLDATIEDNMQIIIKNPKDYSISVGEDSFNVVSVFDNVSDVLNELDIILGEKDYTEPGLDSKLVNGDSIKLFKYKEDIEKEEIQIDFERIVQKNNKLDKGISNVIQEGSKGKKVKETKKVYLNNELVEEVVLKEEVLVEPVDQIVEKGTKERVKTSRGNTSFKHSVVMTATAYDLSYESNGKRPGDKYYGLTASGTKIRHGAVAVDPNVIPLGTKLYIESMDSWPDYGFATAEDTGGAIKGNKIDLFIANRSEMFRFGRRKVKVYILD